jgi:hypothetical protein
MLALVLGALLATGLSTVSSATATSAHHSDYFGDSSRSVARHIGCKRFHRPQDSGGRGTYHLDSGDCWLKGKLVSVVTFRGAGQQREWNAAASVILPTDHWWANGKGAVVIAESGSKRAARAGAIALPGKLTRGSSVFTRTGSSAAS